jgi:hypothetical protein
LTLEKNLISNREKRLSHGSAQVNTTLVNPNFLTVRTPLKMNLVEMRLGFDKI